MRDPENTLLRQKSQTLRDILELVGKYRQEFKEPVQMCVVNRRFGKRCAKFGGLSKMIGELEAQGLVFSELSRNGSMFLSLEKGSDPLPLKLVRS